MRIFGPLHDTNKTYHSPAHEEMYLLGGKVPMWRWVEAYDYYPLNARGVALMCVLGVVFIAALAVPFAWMMWLTY